MTIFAPLQLQPAMQQSRSTYPYGASAGSHIEQTPIGSGFGALDLLLPQGGIPRGSFTEIRGRPGDGALSLALAIAAQAQAGGDLVAYIDLNSNFDARNAVSRGIDPEHLLLIRPADTAQALAIVQALVHSGDAGAVLIDTLNQLAAGDAAARQLDQALLSWIEPLGRTRCALLGLVDETGAAVRYWGQGSTLDRTAALRLSVACCHRIEQAALFTPQLHTAATLCEVSVLAQPGQIAARSTMLTFPLPA